MENKETNVYTFYVITNLVNNKQYIGLTYKTVKMRFLQHGYNNLVISKAIKKHGRDNFVYEELEKCVCTKEEAENKEKALIAVYKTLVPNGYNVSKGGKYQDDSSRDKNSEGFRVYWEKLTGKESVPRDYIKNVNKLTREYIETGEESIWDKLLIPELYKIIDFILSTKYQSVMSFWDDLKQDAIISLWENRGAIKNTASQSFYHHYYLRIRNILNRNIKKYDGTIDEENELGGIVYKERRQPKYDSLDIKTTSFEELSIKERQDVGLEPLEDDFNSYEED